MATIALGGHLQPSSHHGVVGARRSHRTADSSSRRHAIRDAARTREIRRVYRRRRLGVTVGFVAVVAVAFITVFSLFGTSAIANSSEGQPQSPKYVVVQPGDTLWSIGERIAPNAAITEVVDELVRLNGTSISVGQLVRIP